MCAFRPNPSPWGWVWHRILDRLPGRSTSQYSIYHSRFVFSYIASSLQQTYQTCQDAGLAPTIIRDLLPCCEYFLPSEQPHTNP
jgi:hypothetical protein